MDFEQRYRPRCVPKRPKNLVTYTEQMMRAPILALSGNARRFPEPPDLKSPRRKVRTINVGITNRWRFPKTLGADFLGISQAYKTIPNPNVTKNFIKKLQADEPATVVSVNSERNLHFSAMSFNSIGFEKLMLKNKHKGLSPRRSLPPFQQPMSSGHQHSIHHRFKDPLKLLEMFARHANYESEPDLMLHCNGIGWPLHSSFVERSSILKRMFADDSKKVHYQSPSAKLVDNYVGSAKCYSNEYKNLTRSLTSEERERIRITTKSKGTLTQPIKNVNFNPKDQWVTNHGISMALGHLYIDHATLASGDIVETLAAACSLKFNTLIEDCCQTVIRNLAPDTICLYIELAKRYKLGSVMASCKRWLELNLIPNLSSTLYLQDLPQFMLEKVLSSSKLFTFKEFAIYKTLCYWIYMQFYPKLKKMPSQTSVMKFFSSRDYSMGFLEREFGSKFQSLFKHLRLHGITEVDHLQDLIHMNIIPEAKMLQIINHHYNALNNGGDMPPFITFSVGACRLGFVLEQEVGYYSQVFHLHGFYFELRVKKREKDNTFCAYIQRLPENDPVLSFRSCKRSRFSLRKDRMTRYEVIFQYAEKSGAANKCDIYKHISTGVHEQRFGVTPDSTRSQVLSANDITFPLYISINMLFPPS